MSADRKRPAFQFYPGDWLRDVSLRRASPTSRALWIDMLCLMHDGEPYGHLRSGGADISAGELARATGFTAPETRRALIELERAGVFSRTDGGTIYSRRMVRDERLREVRGASGRLGGNPKLVNHNAEILVNQTANQKPTPAVCSLQSASALQPQKHKKRVSGEARATVLPAGWQPNETHTALAAELGLSVAGEVAQFRDHWAANAKPKANWDAAFRTWLRNAVRFGPAPAPPAPAPEPRAALTPEQAAAERERRRAFALLRDFLGSRETRKDAWRRANSAEREGLLCEVKARGFEAQFGEYFGENAIKKTEAAQ